MRTAPFTLGALIAGCSLPYQQLSLPEPILPAATDHKALATGSIGTPLSGPATLSGDHSAIYPGSGEFAKDVTDKRAGDVPAPGAVTAANGSPVTTIAAAATPNVTSSPASEVSKAGITINLVNASVPEVAKTVLGDVLGVNYVVSDKVKATITLRTVHPVDKAGLFDIFQAVLRSEDVAVVTEGSLYKIVPSVEAAASGVPLQSRKTGGRNVVGLASEIVPLRFVAAAEMERILKSAAPAASVGRTDANRNLLLISGTKTELDSMNELINVFDVDWMRGMSFALFPVETSDPDAIAQELDVIFANDKDSPTKGVVRFIPNRRLKSVLVISSRPEYLKKVETWMSRIDQASQATEKQVFVYHVQNRPANELAQLLQKVYKASGASGQQSSKGGSDLGSGTTGSNVTGTTASDASTLVPAPVAAPVINAPGQAGTGSPQDPSQQRATDASVGGNSVLAADSAGANTEGQKTDIGGGLPPDDRNSGISVVADEPNNSLVITATTSEYKRIKNILRTIDITGNQVMIEATIAEVTLSDELKFGVRWFFEKGGNQLSLGNVGNAAAAAIAPGFSYFLTVNNVKAAINALSTITDVNVVSSPTLMVLENKKAVLQIGDEVPIATQSAVSVISPGSPIVNSVSFRNTGVILGITPRVSDNGKVVLEIEQEVSDVVPTTSSKIDSPTIQQRRIKTTVNVEDGKGILLAGLIQDKSTRERSQIPLLGDLPYIGNAFKSKTDTIKRTELLIAITPQVIRDQLQIDQVTSEFRDNLNLTTRPQRQTSPDHRETLDRLVR